MIHCLLILSPGRKQFSVAARKINLIGILVSAQSPDWAYLMDLCLSVFSSKWLVETVISLSVLVDRLLFVDCLVVSLNPLLCQ